MGNSDREKRSKSNKRKFNRIRIISSSEESDYDNDDDSSYRRRSCNRAASRSRSRSPIVIVHHDASPDRYSPSPGPADNAAQPVDDSSSQPQPEPSTATTDNCAEEMELDEDILLLLGDAPKTDAPLGPPVHKDLASRWQEILANGLQKEARETILKEHLIPSNCDLLLAPELNPEAKAALSEVFIKRDTALMNKQKQVAVALSALATVTQLINLNETSKQKLLKPLSDACRILCDSHHKETTTRRNFVTSSINSSLKDTLVEAKRGKFLFGDNVGEKLKIAKDIQRSGEALKNQPKSVFNKNNFAMKKGRLNYQQTHRKTFPYNKPFGDQARAARPSPRQTPRGSAASAAAASSRARRPTDRSPQRRSRR